MFDSTKARECLSGLIGWRDHHDLNEIPSLSNGLKVSETGEFYQEKHPALRLDLIMAMLPENKDLEEYLIEVEDSSITAMLNDITIGKEMSKTSKELVTNDVIYNGRGFPKDTITNESRFVGIRFRPAFSIGLKAKVNRLALQLTQAQTGLTGLDIYLYHSHKTKYVAKFSYITSLGNQFNWQDVDFEMLADDSDLSGGVFYLGYYQDDLIGQAISYEKLNWKTGYCGGCDGGTNQKRYVSIAKYVNMQAFYVPNSGLNADHDFIFDPDGMIEDDTTNWGFNFNISIKCDLTNFWCDNRLTLRTVLGLQVVQRVLKDISFSQQMNHIEEQLKMMIIRDLEGDKETNYRNIPQQYERALKAINFNHSEINSLCLPCAVDSGTTYDTM